MADASCSSSAFKRFTQDSASSHLGPRQDRVLVGPLRNDSLAQRLSRGDHHEISASAWTAFSTPGFKDTIETGPPSSTIRAPPLIGRDVPHFPAAADEVQIPAGWTTEYATFGGNAAQHTGEILPTASHLVSTPLSMTCSPHIMQTTSLLMHKPAAIIEAEFDHEMDRWMSDYGGHNKGEGDVQAPQPQAPQPQSPWTISHNNSEAIQQDTETVQWPSSALSEAARALLQAVVHEDSDKWRDSTFLSLMKEFRDGKKNIVGDEITNRL